MTGPVVIVAGAGGAGAAAARRLAAARAYPVVLDSKADHAIAVAEAASPQGAEGHGINLLDLEAVEALRDDLLSRLGRVDAVVHLVGGWKGDPDLGAVSVANWQALHPPIVGTLAVLTAAFGSTVRSAESGRVLMVTSTTAAHPSVTNIAYAAAKRAAEGWMDGVAAYFADSSAAAVTIAVQALLTDAMHAADPEKDWSSYTHVDALADTITALCLSDAVNGSRLDLTTPTTT